MCPFIIVGSAMRRARGHYLNRWGPTGTWILRSKIKWNNNHNTNDFLLKKRISQSVKSSYGNVSEYAWYFFINITGIVFLINTMLSSLIINHIICDVARRDDTRAVRIVNIFFPYNIPSRLWKSGAVCRIRLICGSVISYTCVIVSIMRSVFPHSGSSLHAMQT